MTVKADIRREIAIPESVQVEVHGALLKIKGSQHFLEQSFLHPKVKLTVEGKKVILFSERGSKREKTVLGSFAAHIKNMMKGVQDVFTYKLKICSGHFPMTVSVAGGEVVIKNFLGESVPRKIKILKGTEVKVAGNEITVSSPNKESAGQMAARIEKICDVGTRDIRIFQDGCYIYDKAGKGVI